MCNLTIVLYVNGSLEKKPQTNIFPIYTSLTRLGLYLSLVILFFFLVG